MNSTIRLACPGICCEVFELTNMTDEWVVTMHSESNGSMSYLLLPMNHSVPPPWFDFPATQAAKISTQLLLPLISAPAVLTIAVQSHFLTRLLARCHHACGSLTGCREQFRCCAAILQGSETDLNSDEPSVGPSLSKHGSLFNIVLSGLPLHYRPGLLSKTPN
jgi:hypothetical protein